MDPTLKLAVLLILLVFVNAFPTKADYGQCKRIVKNWASSALDQEVEDKHTLQDLLFFLHVPRTGGRTYFHCFLKKLYPSSLECPRSYDKLRFDPSKPECRLLATHDDYSIISKLPREKTSVVTILRNPIDRVFSTYEFSIEVAARFLVHPNLTSATQMAGRMRSKTKGVSTLDIWPWKYLVPWMREDLFARRDARARAHKDSNYIESNDSYNMEDVAMSLHEYINNPIAMDVVHNGATYQVAGLTNNSFLAESHEVRHCIQKYKTLGVYVLQVAKKRLDDMLYVGLTEDHRESATMFADVVGSQVISQLAAAGAESAGDNRSEQNSSDPEPDFNNDHQIITTTDQKSDEIVSTDNADEVKEDMSVGKLMGAYESCISNLRKAQSRRRTNSLKRISPANFTKEARLQVPEAVLHEIMSLNSLDVELYKHAQRIFAKQQEHIVQKLNAEESLESIFYKSYGTTTVWKLVAIALSGGVIMSLIFIFVNATRRTSKVKI